MNVISDTVVGGAVGRILCFFSMFHGPCKIGFEFKVKLLSNEVHIFSPLLFCYYISLYVLKHIPFCVFIWRFIYHVLLKVIVLACEFLLVFLLSMTYVSFCVSFRFCFVS